MNKNQHLPDTTETTISRGIHIKGDISSDNDMWVDGHVEGSIATAGTLTVEQNARIEGDVSGRDIRINGRISGNVNADDSVTCGVAAVIHGDINTAELTVENGASIRGTVVAGSSEENIPEEDAIE